MRTLPTVLLLMALGLPGLLSCDEADPAPSRIVVTHEMTVYWDLLPHRISELELTLRQDSATEAAVLASNDGGSFGVVDTPGARYGLAVWRSRQLVSRVASVTVEIPPGSTVDGEPFSATAPLTVQDADLAGASGLVALLRGYRIATDDYDAPPDFVSDIPYDPGDGYTTQGYGIALGAPTVSGDEITVSVRARNSLGPADRGDMNTAIPLATTWVRVDVLLVGVRGEADLRRETVGYTLSTAEYGQDTEHPHAPEADQLLSFEGEPGPDQALFGITAFDVWVNLDGHRDPSCVVVQDATNFDGDPISGPGRYLTSLTVRLWDRAYEPTTGAGAARLDLHVSNSAQFKEVGNLCAGFSGEVAMLQFSDPEAGRYAPATTDFTFEPGEPAEEPVALAAPIR